MASYHNNGFSWYIKWYENGEPRKKKIGRVTNTSEADARLAAKAKEVELETGRRILPTGTVFGNFAETYLEWHSMEFPDSHYRVKQITEGHLIPFFSAYSIDGIPVMEAERYKSLRKDQGAAPGTIEKELRTLKAIVNKAIEWDIIDRNPIRNVQPPRSRKDAPPPFYTVEQLTHIYEAHSERRHWWRFMANTGLRRGEVLQISKNDIAGDSLRVVSDEGARTKSGKWREVPLNNPAQDALKEIRGESGFVFPRMVPRSLSRHFSNDSAAVGGSIHWLRHTYCSHLVMAGVPLRVVQKLAGHSTYRVTERYAHLIPGYMRDEANRIGL